MCWAHASTTRTQRKINHNLHCIKNKELEKQLISDIDSLQASFSIDIFNFLYKAFVNKWTLIQEQHNLKEIKTKEIIN